MKPILDTSKYQNSLNVLTVSCMDSSTVKRIVLVKGPSWRVLGGGDSDSLLEWTFGEKKEKNFHSVTLLLRISEYRV